MALFSVAATQVALPSGDAVIESVVEDRFAREGGQPEDAWKRPWRFVILFNSSQAQNRSAYTNSALQSVRTFLTRRASDGQPHQVWFFPYQLDLYTGPDQSVQGVVLDEEAINRVERVFPRVRFSTLADGITPYPRRGGHNNIGARRAASEQVGQSMQPTLLIQITDIVISEAPGQAADEATRRGEFSGSGTESAGLVQYRAPIDALPTGIEGQTMSLLLYGPSQLFTPKPPEARFNWTILLAIVIILVALYILYWIVRWLIAAGSMRKWSITLPENAAIVLERGETVSVYGKGAKPSPGEQFAVLKAEGVPDAKLFEVQWQKAGVRFKSHIWSVTSTEDERDPVITQDESLLCLDTTNNKTRQISVKITPL
jgi:hypothetical protein